MKYVCVWAECSSLSAFSLSPTVVSSKNPNVSGKVDHKQWAVAEYRRDGKLNLDVTTLEGLNVFDSSSSLVSLVPSGDVTDDGLISGYALNINEAVKKRDQIALKSLEYMFDKISSFKF